MLKCVQFLQELYISQEDEWYIIWFLTQESVGFNFYLFILLGEFSQLCDKFFLIV
jgi:hypothetical protein